MMAISRGTVLPWNLLVYWLAHFPWYLTTLLHRYLDRDLHRHLDTLSDWLLMAHLLRDRSWNCGAVCAWYRHTHRDRDTLRNSHLAGSLDRNLLALPLCMVLALGRMLVVGHRGWRSNMGSCSMKELSISISFCFCFSICICFTFCHRMRMWMRWS